MGTRRRRTPRNPHHLIREVEDAEVKELSIQRNLRQVAVVSSDASLEEIKALCRQDHGPGKYRVVPISVETGRQMRGHASFEIGKQERHLLGNISAASGTPDGFLSEQQKTLREQQQALEDARRRLEEDREKMVGDIIATKTSATDKEKDRIDKFLLHQAELQAKVEERRMELEEEHKSRERERNAQLELERAKIENRKAELDLKMAELQEKKYSLEVEHERKLFELKFDQLRAENERQRELDRQALELERQKMELEARQRESELQRKYGFSAEAGVPKSILTEAWKRRLDEELPQKSDLERALEKYVNPLMAYLQHRGGMQKSLAAPDGARVSSAEMQQHAGDVEDEQLVFSSSDF